MARKKKKFIYSHLKMSSLNNRVFKTVKTGNWEPGAQAALSATHSKSAQVTPFTIPWFTARKNQIYILKLQTAFSMLSLKYSIYAFAGGYEILANETISSFWEVCFITP